MSVATVFAPEAVPLLSRDRIVAQAGFNRWLAPPVALAMQMCIGMTYGLSVFWLPLTKALSPAAPAPGCPDLAQALFATTCEWRLGDLVIMYSILAIAFGIAAAVLGSWVERSGPRKAGVAAAFLWGGGLTLGALGVHLHQLWIVWLGLGVVGGIGLGVGYVTPISTLIKWFPDRRGLATGLAVMGFGGGAIVGSPIAASLMTHFREANPASVGVAETLGVMGAAYCLIILAAAFAFRLPPAGWAPEGWTPPVVVGGMISSGHVSLGDAQRSPQFWLLCAMFSLNSSTGVSILAAASPMIQEIFGGALVGLPEVGFVALDASQKAAIAAAAVGFVGLLSLSNIIGRFVWSTMSDRIGRKATFATFFVIAGTLYAAAPAVAGLGHHGLFIVFFCIILSLYGGGFATIPAYLADIFGTRSVGAIHSRLLAWGTIGILGPMAVAADRQTRAAEGFAGVELYAPTMYILACLMALGFMLNLMVRPLDPRKLAQTAPEPAASTSRPVEPARTRRAGNGGGTFALAAAWTIVGLPLLWGLAMTLQKAWTLFG